MESDDKNSQAELSENALDALLKRAALGRAGPPDEMFGQRIMASLPAPSQPGFWRLLHAALIGAAGLATAAMIFEHRLELATIFTRSLAMGQVQLTIASCTPYLILTGLAWLGYRSAVE